MQELADYNLPLTMDIKPEKLKMKKLKRLDKGDKPKKKKKLKVRVTVLYFYVFALISWLTCIPLHFGTSLHSHDRLAHVLFGSLSNRLQIL